MRTSRWITIALSALLLAACNDEPAKPKAPTGSNVLMTIDGLNITFDDVEPIVAFLKRSHPGVGRKTVTQMVLEKHLVPLRLAERAFASERETLHRQAMDVHEVAGNVLELEARKQNLEVVQRRQLTVLQAELPVAMFLFDPLLHGAVSEPIPVPRGFMVAAVHDYTETPVAGEDMVEATQVGFFTHTVGAWHEWLKAEQQRTADKVTYVHPDYREALPTWCKAPPIPKLK